MILCSDIVRMVLRFDSESVPPNSQEEEDIVVHLIHETALGHIVYELKDDKVDKTFKKCFDKLIQQSRSILAILPGTYQFKVQTKRGSRFKSRYTLAFYVYCDNEEELQNIRGNEMKEMVKDMMQEILKDEEFQECHEFCKTALLDLVVEVPESDELHFIKYQREKGEDSSLYIYTLPL